jgi:hypothetical protein
VNKCTAENECQFFFSTQKVLQTAEATEEEEEAAEPAADFI